MERKLTVILEKGNGNKICASALRDAGSQRLSAVIYHQTPEGRMTIQETVRRSDLIRQKRVLDFVLDLPGGFDEDDLIEIAEGLKTLLEKVSEDAVVISEKLPAEEVYRRAVEFICDNREDLEDNPRAEIYTNKGYGYIKTTRMKEFVTTGDLGYTKLEVLRQLLLMDVLLPGNDRTYDRMVNVNGRRRKFYVIKLPTVPDRLCDKIDIEPKERGVVDEIKSILWR